MNASGHGVVVLGQVTRQRADPEQRLIDGLSIGSRRSEKQNGKKKCDEKCEGGAKGSPHARAALRQGVFFTRAFMAAA